ncbi:hypothetical protein JOC85_002264 [Bacillus mesophilus]|uniref:SCP2 sterol-binding domain-containing protein n=1 Tax=Bacillus mesophilus TaxID=1808955 RepID=A0A6M0Q715_9BACI|nr:hypothetical protein [Bacillus mesophilus]MBM7661461.1 hypothetical protein [Bacillus mesophilus]NEY72132.1 hypothetical protein [Bacillus mesophilus]
MKELLEQFASAVLREKHLRPILPSTPIYVCFQLDYELVFIKISTDGCEIFAKSQGRTDVWIKGDCETLQFIITGKERIRKLESENRIRLTGKLKDILLAEALFYLSEKRLSA